MCFVSMVHVWGWSYLPRSKTRSWSLQFIDEEVNFIGSRISSLGHVLMFVQDFDVLMFVSSLGHVFLSNDWIRFGCEGSVHTKNCSSVAEDMILTFGSFCSSLAYFPGFRNPWVCSYVFWHIEWHQLVQCNVQISKIIVFIFKIEKTLIFIEVRFKSNHLFISYNSKIRVIRKTMCNPKS